MAIIESVEVEIEVNTSKLKKWFNEALDDIKWFNKRIKSDVAIKLSLRTGELKIQLDALRKELRKTTSKKHRIEIQSNIDRISNQLTQAKRELRNFARTWRKDLSVLWKLFNSVNDEIKESRRELIRLWKSTVQLDKLERKFKEWKISVQDFRRELQKIKPWFISKLWWSIKNLAISLWLLFIARKVWRAFSFMSRTAIEFESAFVWVRKTLEWTESDFLGIEKGLINLSKTIPLTVVELGKIAEIWGQLWIATDDILNFTKVVAKIWVSTNVTSEEAAIAFARIAQIMNEPISNLDRMASAVVWLWNNFAAMESEILTFTSRIAGAGNIVWLSTADIFGIATAFAAVWIQAETGGTAVQKALLTINEAVLNWWIQLEKFGALTWQTAQEFAASWKKDAWGAFTDFVIALWESWDDSVKILQDLLNKDVRLARSFLSVAWAWDLLRKSMERANTEFRENNALNEEAAKAFAKTEARLDIVKNKWTALGNTVWKNLNEFFIPFFETWTDFFTFEFPQWIWIASAAIRDFLVIATPVLLKNFQKRFFNLAENIWIAFWNIPALAKEWLNAFIQLIWNTINKAIDILNKIPKVDIDPVLFTGFWPQTLKEFKDINAWVIDLREKMKQWFTAIAIKQFLEEKKAREWFDEDRKDQERGEATDAQKKNQKLLDLMKKGWKEEADAQKKIDEAKKKALKNFNNFREFLADKQKKREEDRIERLEEQFKVATKFIAEEVKAQEKLIDTLRDAKAEIDDINKSLAELESWSIEDLSARFIEIKKRLKELKSESREWGLSGEDQEERRKLKQELLELRKNVTKEEIAEAERLDELNPTERILEELEAERMKLEVRKEQITEEIELEVWKEQTITEALDEEIILQNFQDLRIRLEELFTEKLWEEAQKQGEFYDENIVKLKKIIALQRQAWLSWAWDITWSSNQQSSGNTNNSTININVSATINNDTDADNLVNKIKQSIIEDKKNWDRNIL